MSDIEIDRSITWVSIWPNKDGLTILTARGKSILPIQKITSIAQAEQNIFKAIVMTTCCGDFIRMRR